MEVQVGRPKNPIADALIRSQKMDGLKKLRLQGHEALLEVQVRRPKNSS
jgi:hypothetical protein